MQAAWLQEAWGEAERRALIDPLTQLWNRHGMRTMLPAMVRRAEREGLKVAFIYGDLDHFKRINDEYGHAGERHLSLAGKSLCLRRVLIRRWAPSPAHCRC